MYKPRELTYNELLLKQQKEQMKQNPVQPTEQPDDPTSRASLWSSASGSPGLIRNQKAQKVGDLLTIIIDENATATTKAKTDTKKQSSIDISGGLSAGQGENQTLGGLSATAGTKNDFKGEGTTNRSGQFQTTVQAVVENVLPNGTLFVRGHKAITINAEDQDVEISGFVRPDDIRINNTVHSTLIADAQVRYLGEGSVGDKQHAGWGSRLVDAIWPW
jgi:flagellar L-ring protein precursor FlgH